MKVGISTACFYPEYNTEDTLEVIKEAGFDLCETFLEAEYEMQPEFCTMLRKRADNLGIKIYSVHGFSSVFEPFLMDRYDRRRSEMTEKFKSMCNAAKILGAKYYVFHGIRNNMKCEDMKLFASHMDNLCSIAEGYGINIAWENVCWCKSTNTDFIKSTVENMKKNIYFTLDIKQAVRGGEDPQHYLDVYGKNIRNVHINDADEENSCLLPGMGNMDIKNVIKRVSCVSEDIPFIIEVYRENFKDINDLKKAKKHIESFFNL